MYKLVITYKMDKFIITDEMYKKKINWWNVWVFDKWWNVQVCNNVKFVKF